MISDAIVNISGVSKTFDKHVAVDDLSFSITRGTIYGLLGPNGAGKTTTIRMIMRIMYPDSGAIEIFGLPLSDVRKENIGYLPEERGVYPKMKVIDLLSFLGQLKMMSATDARKAAWEWLTRVKLANVGDKKVEELSKGMQQKVQFICTVINRPELIILDEPFSGLDPVNADILKNIILEFHDAGHTIVFSTHVMDQVEKLCESICLMNNGRKVLEGSLSEIKRSYGHNGVTIRFEGDGAFLQELPEVESSNANRNEVFLRLRDGADTQHLLQKACSRLTVLKFEVSEPSINDIFVEQVGGK